MIRKVLSLRPPGQETLQSRAPLLAWVGHLLEVIPSPHAPRLGSPIGLLTLWANC